MMYPFKLPDYKGENIVNLMSSISRCFGKHGGVSNDEMIVPLILIEC